MEKMLEVCLMVAMALTSAMARDLLVDDEVKVVNVERFGGNLPPCKEKQVCADVFDFTRDHGDGTGHRESRIIANCRCETGPKCGSTGDQLLFKETITQSMLTCENAVNFTVCEPGQIAKEQHNTGVSVFYKINCVCPNNEYPSDFKNKMTVRKSFLNMTPKEKDAVRANRRARFFRCREEDDFRPSIFK